MWPLDNIRREVRWQADRLATRFRYNRLARLCFPRTLARIRAREEVRAREAARAWEDALILEEARLLEERRRQEAEWARQNLRHGTFEEDARMDPYERALALLEENLTPIQRAQYAEYGHFEVVGGNTGKRYRIRYGHHMNVDEIDRSGEPVCTWCFVPNGELEPGDVMLAQKMALELFEDAALLVANQYPPPRVDLMRYDFEAAATHDRHYGRIA